MTGISCIEAIRDGIKEEMDRDEGVFVMGPGVGASHPLGDSYSVTKGLKEIYGPERVRNTPISETAIISGAVGAAMAGMMPIVEIPFSSHLAIAMDELWNQASKLRYMSGGQFKIPIVVRTSNSMGAGLGPQYSESPESWFIHMPGFKVVVPSSGTI